MKLLLTLIASFALAGQAYADGIDVPNATPIQFGKMQWTYLGDNEATAYWYASEQDADFGTFIILKAATKALGKGYTLVTFISGFGDCRQTSQGQYPAALWNAQLEKINARNGMALPGYSEPVALGEFAIERGNALADAVKASCDAYAKRHGAG